MNSDEEWMRVALSEAVKGIGKTSPNPAVGAVIVKNGELLAKGWHRAAGKSHAEIEAIRSLKKPEMARGSTIFVTLEPCSSHGRTPPCVEAILQHGVARVVVGAVDPNPKHAGKGLQILRNAGIEVVSGVLERESASLNEAFNHWIVTGHPLVIAKCAMSLDGRITRREEEGQWITSPLARRHVHQLRSRVDAILVGAETVRKDNPRLTVRRTKNQRQPWRVVLSRSGNLPSNCHLLTDEWKERTLVFNDLPTALKDLGKRQVTSVLIEGGGEILGEAFDARLVARIVFYYAPMILGGEKPSVAGLGVGNNESSLDLVDVKWKKIGDDLLCEARIK